MVEWFIKFAWVFFVLTIHKGIKMDVMANKYPLIKCKLYTSGLIKWSKVFPVSIRHKSMVMDIKANIYPFLKCLL